MRASFWTFALSLLLAALKILAQVQTNDVTQPSLTISGATPDYYQYLQYYNYLQYLASQGKLPSNNGDTTPVVGNSMAMPLMAGSPIPVSAPMPSLGSALMSLPGSATMQSAGSVLVQLPGSAPIPSPPTIPGTSMSINTVPTGIQVYDPSKYWSYPYVYSNPGVQYFPFANAQSFFGIPCKVESSLGNCINSSNNLAVQLCTLLGNQLREGNCASGTSCCYSTIPSQPHVTAHVIDSKPTITEACFSSDSNKGFCIEDSVRGHEYCTSLSFSVTSSTCTNGFFCCYKQLSGQNYKPVLQEVRQKNNICGIKGVSRSNSEVYTSPNNMPVYTTTPSNININNYPVNNPPVYIPVYTTTPSNININNYPVNNPSVYAPSNSITSPVYNNPAIYNAPYSFFQPLYNNSPILNSVHSSVTALPNLNISTDSSLATRSVGSVWQHLKRKKRDSNPAAINPFSSEATNAPTGGGSEYCWQVAIYVNGKFKCSGSLIQSQWILTSAYCVFGQDPFNIRVRIGLSNLNGDNSEYQTKTVEDIYVNENYDPDSAGYENNVALVHLKVPATLINACLICLPGIPSDLLVDQACTVTGYGSNALGQKAASLLRQVTQAIVSDSYCASTISKVVRNFAYDQSYLCAGGASGADSCLADGGSPLVCQDDKGIYQQYGIASWSIGCGVNNIPTIYTDVYTFVDWIHHTIDTVEKEPAVFRQYDKNQRIKSS